MTWTFAEPSIWTKSGTAREVVIPDDRNAPGSFAMRVQIEDCADAIKLLVRSSRRGHTCFEVGFDATGAGGNVEVRQILQGGIPSAALASAAHGVAAATPAVMEVRLENDEIKCLINETQLFAYTIATSETLAGYRYFGFSSTVNNAKVLWFEICDLVPQVTNRRDILIAVCEGDVWVSNAAGTGISQLAQNVFNATGDVALVEYQQKVYGVDGEKAKIIDPAAGTVTDWTASSGSLPGAGGAGTTTATVIERYRDRIVLAGVETDPQNLWMSAVGDALDWDSAAIDSPGRAFVLGGAGGSQAGRVGQPIVSIKTTSADSILIGCSGEIWELIGDPALGIPDPVPRMKQNGISGKDAMLLVEEGFVIGHSPEGVVLQTAGGPCSNISKTFLTDGIQISRDQVESYIVIVARDTKRHVTHFFLTPRSSGSAVHFAYEERVGGFQAGTGGLMPESYQDSMGPTACTQEPWRGRLVMGSRDGYLWEFDDSAKNDVVPTATAIDCYFTTELLDDPDSETETELVNLKVTPTIASDDVDWTAYGGQTPEEAYVGIARWPLKSGTVTYPGKIDRRHVRAGAIVIDFQNDTLGESIAIEKIEVDTRPRRLLARRARQFETINPDTSLPDISGGGTTPVNPPDPDPPPAPATCWEKWEEHIQDTLGREMSEVQDIIDSVFSYLPPKERVTLECLADCFCAMPSGPGYSEPTDGSWDDYQDVTWAQMAAFVKDCGLNPWG